MKKRIIGLVVLMISLMLPAYSQCYTLVSPSCVTYSFGVGYLFNNRVGDLNFNQNYITYNINAGKYFDKNIGLSGNFLVGNSTTRGEKTRIYSIGLELNTRITDYYAYSPMDLGFNVGLSYGRYDFADSWIDSEGMDYFVPKVSFDIIFNLSGDKAYQFVIEPSYQHFIQAETKYYYDDGSKVNGNISAFGITGKLRVNF